MRVAAAVGKRCIQCKIFRRRKRLRVNCVNKRHKQRQG